MRQRRLCGVERRRQADGDDGVPLVLGERLDGGDVLDARVVAEDLQPAEAVGDAGDHRPDRRGAGQVGVAVVDAHAVLVLDRRLVGQFIQGRGREGFEGWGGAKQRARSAYSAGSSSGDGGRCGEALLPAAGGESAAAETRDVLDPQGPATLLVRLTARVDAHCPAPTAPQPPPWPRADLDVGDRRLVAKAVDCDVGTGGRERARHREADARRAARHERDLAGEQRHGGGNLGLARAAPKKNACCCVCTTRARALSGRSACAFAAYSSRNTGARCASFRPLNVANEHSELLACCTACGWSAASAESLRWVSATIFSLDLETVCHCQRALASWTARCL